MFDVYIIFLSCSHSYFFYLFIYFLVHTHVCLLLFSYFFKYLQSLKKEEEEEEEKLAVYIFFTTFEIQKSAIYVVPLFIRYHVFHPAHCYCFKISPI